ncbi:MULTISPECIES: LysM peptidoglycan-binding domain-containing protein [Bacillus]|uniref:LysM peptidoglycan-binding domain-containing protein n=1 Tax=Bacillus TaxID=1386 RepID=UPI000BB8B9E3|nr:MULTISPECIES: LysM peptidoglycan-binding domain-containing protein [Bacillus]
MSLFYKHEWDEENKELTLFINQTFAFYELASDLIQNKKNESPVKQNLLEAAREYVNSQFVDKKKVKTYRIKMQNFLVSVFQAKEYDEGPLVDNDVTYYKTNKTVKVNELAEELCINCKTLQSINDLTESFVPSGTKLKIPIYHHTVVTADSLRRIAQKYDVTMESIREINQLQTDCLKAGQHLVIPKPC